MDNTTNFYITGNDFTSATADSGLTIIGTADYKNKIISSIKVEQKGIHPKLYFKYIKNKFKTLEKIKINAGLKRIEKAFNKAVDNGQSALGEKLLNKIIIATRELLIYSKGIKYFIEREYLYKYKYKIRDGKISDTILKDYTRIIPKNIIKKKNAVEDIFDNFVIFHYWNENQKDVKKMSSEEKEKMKDPVLFGIIKETDKLYYIADWEDEYCDLTFEEIIDELGCEEEEIKLKRKVEF